MKTNFIIDSERLDLLPPGTEAVVRSVDVEGAIGRRLVDLGLRPDTRIRVMRRAPLGDPTIYELRGYQLCLRRTEACQVRVRPIDAEVPPRALASSLLSRRCLSVSWSVVFSCSFRVLSLFLSCSFSDVRAL